MNEWKFDNEELKMNNDSKDEQLDFGRRNESVH